MEVDSGRRVMATKRWIVFFPAAAMISMLAGCSSGSNNMQTPPPPPQSQVTIAFQPEPSGSVAVGFTENVTAVVTNDPSNLGVEWNLVCQSSGNCGQICTSANANCGLTMLHTASGSAITYTTPPTLSAESMVVEIVAFASADQNKNVVAPITISSFDSSLPAGTYVFQAQGVDINLNSYQVAGVIALDGNGNITNGEQTANYLNGSLSDANLTGSYFLGSDGRGILTINTNDRNIGSNANGVETFSFVLLSGSHALISQFDLGSANTGTSATGTMDLQTSTSAPSGGYAFVVNGIQVPKTVLTGANVFLALGGILNIDSPNTISGNGSVIDEILQFKTTPDLAVSGTVTAPDSFGKVTISLSGAFSPSHPPANVQLTGYIVDNTHIHLIESDNVAGAGFGSTAGPAIAQGAATGTFTSNASFSGTYVFGVTGVDLSTLNAPPIFPNTLTSAGLFTADGNGNLINGFTDTFLLLNNVQGTSSHPQSGAQISAAFGGTYSVDTTGTGRATLTLDNFTPNPRFGFQPTVLYYLTGNGNPPLVLEGGDTHYQLLGTGIAYPQSTAAPAFSGDYGFSFTQQNGVETDGTAQMNANPSANPNPPTGTGSGVVDASNSEGLDNGFLGTFNNPTSNVPFAGTLYANPNAVNSNVFPLVGTPAVPMAVDYYFIDPEHGFWIETDLVNSVPPATAPNPSAQVSIGYYAGRTPVCTGCP